MRMPIKKPSISLLDWFVEKVKRKYKGSKNRKVITINTMKLLKFRPTNWKKIITVLVKLKEGLISKSPPLSYTYFPARLTSMKSANILG